MMERYAGIFGFVHFLSSWFTKLAISNLLWFLLNLPVTIILVSYFLKGGGVIYLLPLLILIPLLSFPSTAALFAMARDWMREEEQASLAGSYLSYVKNNYRISVHSGFVWLLLWGIWLIDFRFFSQQSDLLATMLFLIGGLLFVMNVHFFSLSVHYQMTVRELVRNSFFITMGRPLLTVGTGLICALVIYASTTIWFLNIFFTGSLLSCISFYLFYKSYLKIKDKAMKNAHGSF